MDVLAADKHDFIVKWMEARGWDREHVELYARDYDEVGLDREALDEPIHTGFARALLDYHLSISLDGWQTLAPHLREHLREQGLKAQQSPLYRLSDRDQGEAVRLGAALETLAGLMNSCPPPAITQPGVSSRPSSLAG